MKLLAVIDRHEIAGLTIDNLVKDRSALRNSKLLDNESWQDEAYIKERCEGYEALLACIESYTPERVEAITGIPREQLYEAARLYATTRKAGIFYTLGITEQ